MKINKLIFQLAIIFCCYLSFESYGVVVPYVIGLPHTTANSTILSAGLTLHDPIYVFDPSSECNTVINQNPPAGTEVEPGTPITLTVAYSINVPNVIDQLEADAISTLTTSGLNYEVEYRCYLDSMRDQRVQTQDPLPNSPACPNDVVTITVYDYDLRLIMPDVVGLSESTANTIVLGTGFTLAKTEYVCTTVVGDHLKVQTQTPAPGSELCPGDLVFLKVWVHDQSVPVPDVVGKTETEAFEDISRYQLVPDITYECTLDPDKLGKVKEQTPSAGESVPCGTTVTITVYSTNSSTLVPLVTGMHISVGEQVLHEAGLIPEVFYRCTDVPEEDGIIQFQSLEEGSTAPCSSVIGIVVNSLTQATVPAVIGLMETDVLSLLSSIGLEATVRYMCCTTPDQAGRVSTQEPVPQTVVSCGSTVVLWVYSMEYATVPSVVDQNEVEAINLLTSIGLLPRVRYQCSTDPNEHRVVLGQSLASDTLAGCGEGIDLDVGIYEVVVPTLVGLFENEALSLLSELGFTSYSVQYICTTDPDQANKVQDQTIPPGTTVHCSEPILLTVAVTQVYVPNVLNRLESEAIAILGMHSLNVITRYVCTSDPNLNLTVKQQDPAPNTLVDCGSTVELTVRILQLPAPNLVDSTESVAIQTLRSLDIMPVVQYVCITDPARDSRVIDQVPSGNTTYNCQENFVLTVGSLYTSTVPNLYGLTESEAVSRVQNVGLSAQVVYVCTTDPQEHGTVKAQDPLPNTTANCGSTVRITIAVIDRTTVPNVIGQLESTASETLANVGLNVSFSYICTNDANQDRRVYQQTPLPNTLVNCGDTIHLTVWSLTQATVPHLVDLTEHEAINLLRSAGLSYEIHYICTSDPAQSRKVLAQEPDTNTMVDCGSTVTLRIGIYELIMPDLIYRNENEAVALLESLGFENYSIRYVCTQNPAEHFKVQNQSVPPNSTVPCDSSVFLTVTATEVKVPDVTNLLSVRAINILRDRGLRTTIRYICTTDPTMDGKVESQSITPETIVPCNSTVELTVRTLNVNAPEVLNLLETEATNILTEWGINPTIMYVCTPDETNAGIVFNQYPEPGVEYNCTEEFLLYVWSYEQVVVPNIIGKAVSEGIPYLEQIGLHANIVYECTDNPLLNDTIKETIPPQGTTLPCGETIRLVVRSLISATVPDVTGYSESEGVSLLEQTGFSVRVRYVCNNDPEQHTKIRTTTPPAGTILHCGDIVTIEVISNDYVTVPNVMNQPEDEAIQTLNNIGLNPVIYYVCTSDPTLHNTIRGQSLVPNSVVPCGESISLSVWSLDRATVPNLVNFYKDDAVQILQDIGLSPVVKEVCAVYPERENTVSMHSPGPGSVIPCGDTVTLTVYTRSIITLPNVVNSLQFDAIELLEDLGLQVKVTYDCTGLDPLQIGRVGNQNPPAGGVVYCGDIVHLTVWATPAVIIPNLINLPIEIAIQQLRSLGLFATIEYVCTTDSLLEGIVRSQFPLPLEEICDRTIVLSVWSTKTNVPNVVGQNEPSAVATLTSSGFTPRITKVCTDDPSKEGIVLEQSPIAGHIEECGKPITIYVGSLENATMPNLIGLREAYAWALLIRSGLNAIATYECTTEPLLDRIVKDQSHPQNAPVPCGELVQLTVWAVVGTSVPNVVGKTELEARELLRNTGLDVNITYICQPDDPTSHKRVVWQNPLPGTGPTLPCGGTVELGIGIYETQVPDIRGYPLDLARNKLLQAHLREGSISYICPTTETQNDTVADLIDFQPGQVVVCDTPINISVYSIDNALPIIPNVVGTSESEAIRELKRRGFVSQISYKCTDTNSTWVESQQPEPDAIGRCSDTVYLEVRNPFKVTVPNLMGYDQRTALSISREVGLSPRVTFRCTSDIELSGKVAEQSLVPGEVVPCMDEIHLVIWDSNYGTIPSVIGLSIEEAEEVANESGFDTRVLEYIQTEDSSLEGRVAEQTPRGDTLFLCSSTIGLTLYTTHPPLRMPYLLNLSEQDAVLHLSSLGLVVKAVIFDCNNTITPGLVSNQNPAYNVPILKSTPIYLTISTGPCSIPISNIFELSQIGQDPRYPANGNYILTQHIDASETASWNGGEGFAPIQRLSGTLHGNGYRIYNLTIQRPIENYVGLIKEVTATGKVLHLHLENANITGRYIVGGIAGYNYGVIEHCTVSGTISAVTNDVGGVVGWNAGTVQRCNSLIETISGTNDVGGLIGYNIGRVLYSFSIANVASVGYNVGGLIGYSKDSHVEKSFAIGYVTSTGNNVGGLIGNHSNGLIADCFTTSSSVSSGESSGGLVGNNVRGSIAQTYSTGWVSGINKVGGLIGSNFMGSILNSYWDINTSSRNDSAGGEGKTTGEMKNPNTYNQWDFATNWAIVKGITYPYLQQIPTPYLETSVPFIGDIPKNRIDIWLKGKGLQLRNIAYRCDNNVPIGNVIEQIPAYGDVVFLNSYVDLVVSNGPCAVKMPNVLGKQITSALEILVPLQLNIADYIEQCDSYYSAGTIICQSPAPAQQLLPQSPIYLIVSSGPCRQKGNNQTNSSEITKSTWDNYTCLDIYPPEGEGTTEGSAEGDVEGAMNEGSTEDEGEEGEITIITTHTADQNGDGMINLSELLRTIQFFNFGEYHCDPLGEDGFAPGPGPQNCPKHAGDYQEPYWKIDLSELLRMIQFFNMGGYYRCSGTEDGFCPGREAN